MNASLPPSASTPRLVFVLATLVAFGPMSIDMYLPSLPTIGDRFDASTGSVQLTLSAFFIGFALGQLLYGPLSDRLGRRPVLLWGISLYVATSVCCALSTSIDQLIIFRFLHALGGGAGTVVARAAVRDCFEQNQAARVLSLMMLVTAIAPLLAPVLGGYVLNWFGWRSIFWLLSGFGVGCWLLVAFGLPETNPSERRKDVSVLSAFAGYQKVLRHPTAIGCILSGGFGFAGMFAYISGTPFVYIELFGVSPQHYGYLFGLNIVGLAIGASLNARLVLRHGAPRMMILGALVNAIAGLVLFINAATGYGGLVGLLVPLFFFIGALNLIAANAIAIASTHFATSAGAVAALFGAAQFGLGALAGGVVGQLHNDTAVPMATVIGVCGMGALVASVWVNRQTNIEP
ncbi:MAG: Bcr/CflA family multidrug efflux MFS transporter [Pseudomonadota bacterium]